jgi:hypothetical protein
LLPDENDGATTWKRHHKPGPNLAEADQKGPTLTRAPLRAAHHVGEIRTD